MYNLHQFHRFHFREMSFWTFSASNKPRLFKEKLDKQSLTTSFRSFLIQSLTGAPKSRLGTVNDFLRQKWFHCFFQDPFAFTPSLLESVECLQQIALNRYLEKGTRLQLLRPSTFYRCSSDCVQQGKPLFSRARDGLSLLASSGKSARNANMGSSADWPSIVAELIGIQVHKIRTTDPTEVVDQPGIPRQ